MKKELKRKARPPGRADPSGKRRTGGTEKGKRKNALSGTLTKISGTVKGKLQTVNVRKVLITNIPYFIVFIWSRRNPGCTGTAPGIPW
jgi:hypothetical protein